MRLPKLETRAEWRVFGRDAASTGKAAPWLIGDWLLLGERKWRETYRTAAEVTGYDSGSLRNFRYVANRFPPSCRHDIGWSFHFEVAALEPKIADRLLEQATDHGWDRKRFRVEVSRVRTARVLNIPLPGPRTCTLRDLRRAVDDGHRYGTIYADPPWEGDVARRSHYEAMTLDEICALPVRDLAADDAHLHLWVINLSLFDAQKVFEAWGFEFASSLAWVKTEAEGEPPSIGMGGCWRNAHELLLTGVRGRATFADRGLPSVVYAPRREHSRKPDEVRAAVERASPGPRLELFARGRPARGWSAWGNQVARADFEASAA